MSGGQIYYQFQASSKEQNALAFEGPIISLAELKQGIVHQQKLGSARDFGLEIVNSQTKEVYKDDAILIPRNTSVVVRRIPITAARGVAPPPAPFSRPTSYQSHTYTSVPKYDASKSSSKVTGGASSEEQEGIDKLLNQKPTWTRRASGGNVRRKCEGPPPPGYVCHRCNQPNHWIQHCPTNGDPQYDLPKIKKATGIPRSFLKPIIGGDHKSAYVVPGGGLAKMAPNEHVFEQEIAKANPVDETKEGEEVPKSFQCPICKDLLKDAVLISCCGYSFCDECIRPQDLSQVLLCPMCKKTTTANKLVPNHSMRTSITEYIKNKEDEKKEKEKAERERQAQIQEAVRLEQEKAALEAARIVQEQREAEEEQKRKEAEKAKEEAEERKATKDTSDKGTELKAHESPRDVEEGEGEEKDPKSIDDASKDDKSDEDSKDKKSSKRPSSPDSEGSRDSSKSKRSSRGIFEPLPDMHIPDFIKEKQHGKDRRGDRHSRHRSPPRRHDYPGQGYGYAYPPAPYGVPPFYHPPFPGYYPPPYGVPPYAPGPHRGRDYGRRDSYRDGHRRRYNSRSRERRHRSRERRSNHSRDKKRRSRRSRDKSPKDSTKSTSHRDEKKDSDKRTPEQEVKTPTSPMLADKSPDSVDYSPSRALDVDFDDAEGNEVEEKKDVSPVASSPKTPTEPADPEEEVMKVEPKEREHNTKKRSRDEDDSRNDRDKKRLRSSDDRSRRDKRRRRDDRDRRDKDRRRERDSKQSSSSSSHRRERDKTRRRGSEDRRDDRDRQRSSSRRSYSPGHGHKRKHERESESASKRRRHRSDKSDRARDHRKSSR